MKLIRNIYNAIGVGLLLMATLSCSEKKARLELSFPEKYEGKTVELMNYADSTVVASATVTDGHAEFVTEQSDSLQFPQFMNIAIDGRIRAFYIAEPGDAFLSDSLSVAKGTPLNDRFAGMMQQLDSIEQTDDLNAYRIFTNRMYNENRDNPIGDYFGIEWLKYAEPQQADSMLSVAGDKFRKGRRVKYYEDLAHSRATTSPGQKYVDFAGQTVRGGRTRLSAYVVPGKYTLVDFMASWCPYCIKELPELKQLYADFSTSGLEIVSVAVRDKTEDTRAMVRNREIEWPVVYNTQKVPYDIYGFTGIPHLMLIGPDGVIISRGENPAQVRKRLEEALAQEQ